MDLLELLAPIGAKKSVRERLRRTYELRKQADGQSDDDEQTGDGVVTRKQAKLQASYNDPSAIFSSNNSQLQKDTSDNFHSDNNDGFDMEDHNAQQQEFQLSSSNQEARPQRTTASPLPGPSQSPDVDENVPESHLFSKETLVAENEDLKAYVVKSYFRRIKNFE